MSGLAELVLHLLQEVVDLLLHHVLVGGWDGPRGGVGLLLVVDVLFIGILHELLVPMVIGETILDQRDLGEAWGEG